MLEIFKHINILKDTKVAGVNLSLLPDDQFEIDLVILKLNKTLISTEENHFTIKEINEVAGYIGNSMPVFLSVDGKGIINKKVESQEGSLSINQVFPNASINDFYIQEVRIDENEEFISLARKEVLDKILEDFEESGVFITSFCLGPFAMNIIADELLDQDETIKIKNNSISLNNLGVNSITRNSNGTESSETISYSLFDEQISSDAIIPFASGIAIFSGNEIGNIDIGLVNIMKKDFFFKKIFNLGYKVALGLIFLILMINYLTFDSLTKKENLISAQYQKSEGLIIQLKDLENKYKIKHELLVKSGLLTASRFSFYADQIAVLVPKDIGLQQMSLSPLIKNLKQGKEILLSRKTINISGSTRQSIILNNWINKIKEQEWVQDVIIVGYKQDDVYSRGEFDIEIILE